ncbi:MAG: N-acetylglucosamine-6-phosphate deacetylase [Pseudomonadota bacterium]
MVDLEGRMVLPGFVDLQVNGGGGVLFNEEITAEAIATIAESHAAYGTAAFLPTLITGTPSEVRRAAHAVAEARRRNIVGVLGLHLEGPFISTAKPGIHPAEKISAFSRSLVDEVLNAGVGVLMMTLAPERIADQDLKYLVDSGVIVWCGHSNATYDQAQRAFDLGAVGVTHLFNAMPPMLSRDPGLVGAALANDHVYTSIIADGHHVHPAVVKAALTAKPRDRQILITDAMSLTGSDLSEFAFGGKTIRSIEGRCVDDAGTLAGADLNMLAALNNAASFCGSTPAELLALTTTNPSSAIRSTESAGVIAEGTPASFVVLDHDGSVFQTWSQGIQTYSKSAI